MTGYSCTPHRRIRGTTRRVLGYRLAAYRSGRYPSTSAADRSAGVAFHVAETRLRPNCSYTAPFIREHAIIDQMFYRCQGRGCDVGDGGYKPLRDQGDHDVLGSMRYGSRKVQGVKN